MRNAITFTQILAAKTTLERELANTSVLRSSKQPTAANLQEVAAMLAGSRATPFLFGGMVIRESPHCTVPRMALSAKVAAIIGHSRPEFVQEMNDWLLEFFGTEERIYVFNHPTTGARTCLVGSRGMAVLRSAK